MTFFKEYQRKLDEQRLKAENLKIKQLEQQNSELISEREQEKLLEKLIKQDELENYKQQVYHVQSENEELQKKLHENSTIQKDFEINSQKIIDEIKKNEEKERKRLREFRINNPNNVKKSKLKYNNSQKGRYNLTKQNQRRLALIKKRPTDLTNEKIKKIFERDKICVYCGSNKKLELDHIISLKKGGTGMFNNFVLACKKCNTSKSARNIFKWCNIQGIKVPNIVLNLLEEQSQGIEIYNLVPGTSEREARLSQ